MVTMWARRTWESEVQKHDIYEAYDFGSHVDAMNGHKDTPSVEMDADTTANGRKIVRMPRKRSKLQDQTVMETA